MYGNKIKGSKQNCSLFQCVQCSAKALNLLDDEDNINVWAVEDYINDNDLGEGLPCLKSNLLHYAAVVFLSNEKYIMASSS